MLDLSNTIECDCIFLLYHISDENIINFNSTIFGIAAIVTYEEFPKTCDDYLKNDALIQI